MDTRNGQGLHQGPSDREIVALLQRLASARAQLLQAEQMASGAQPSIVVAARNNEIEDAQPALPPLQHDVHWIARGPRHRVDHHPLLAKQPVDERRFADVGPADNRDLRVVDVHVT